MAVCAQMGLRPLVVTPKSTIPNWYNVAEVFDIDPLGVVNYETAKNGKYYEDLETFYANQRVVCPYIEVIRELVEGVTTPAGHPKYRIAEIKWKLPPNSIIIFDEAQRGKNGITSGGPMGKGATATSQLLVSTKPYIKKSAGVYGAFLSATLTDKIECFDVMCYHLGFFAPYSGKAYLNFTKTLGSEPMKRLHEKIVPKFGARMSIEDIKAYSGNSVFKENDLKAKAYAMEPNVAMQIEQQHQAIQGAMQAIRAKESMQDNPLTVMLRARQKIEMLKIPTFTELTEKYLRAGKHIVWFLNFKETNTQLVKKILALREDPDDSTSERMLTMSDIDFIDGTNSAEEREEIRIAFQADEIKVLICQIRAGGVGISLHDIVGDHERVSLISPTWSAIELHQSVGRIYRSNAKTDAKQRIIYCKPSAVPSETSETSENTNPIETAASTESEPEVPGAGMHGMSALMTYLAPETTDTTETTDNGDNGETTYTIEEQICKNVNAKLRNILLLNEGDLAGYQDLV
jgi:hypothetical protein